MPARTGHDGEHDETVAVRREPDVDGVAEAPARDRSAVQLVAAQDNDLTTPDGYRRVHGVNLTCPNVHG